MKLKAVKNLDKTKNRFKVEAILNKNELSSEDLLYQLQNKLKETSFDLAQKLRIKSEYREADNVVAIFEPVQRIRLNKAGLQTVSKTNNIFRDPYTDGLWKEIVDENGNVKLIRVLDENLANLIRTNTQLKLAAFVISTKDLKAGDIITFVSTKGNMEAALIISADFMYNFVTNKVQKISSLSSDDITSYKSNEDVELEDQKDIQEMYEKTGDLNYVRESEQSQKDLQSDLNQIINTTSEISKLNKDNKINIVTKQERSNTLKAQLKTAISKVLNNKIQQNRMNRTLSCITNF